MSKIICMASAKGGSGKTILTATFAAFLVALNKKVLIVDVDASTNGLTLLYLKEVMFQNEHAISEGRKAIGTYEFESTLMYYLEITILPNGVHMIPATYSFMNTESIDILNFKNSLKEIKTIHSQNYDYIFLDAQAGSDHFAHEAMNKNISNEVIIVSEYDPLSAAGVERLKALFREDLTYNRTWVLLNKMLPDFVKSFSDFLEIAKYLSPIPWDAEVVKSYSRRKLAIDIEYGNEFTLAVIQTLKSLFNEELSSELSNWVLQKASPLKEPLKVQYDDTLKQLETMFEVQNRINKQFSFITIKDFTSTNPSFTMLFLIMIIISAISIIGSEYSIVLIFTIPIILSLILIIRSNLDKTVDIDDYKLKREISSLEEKLKKLEGLMDLSPEELIKNKVK